jgi:hypothetical protein
MDSIKTLKHRGKKRSSFRVVVLPGLVGVEEGVVRELRLVDQVLCSPMSVMALILMIANRGKD